MESILLIEEQEMWSQRLSALWTGYHLLKFDLAVVALIREEMEVHASYFLDISMDIVIEVLILQGWLNVQIIDVLGDEDCFFV